RLAVDEGLDVHPINDSKKKSKATLVMTTMVSPSPLNQCYENTKKPCLIQGRLLIVYQEGQVSHLPYKRCHDL
ncbi:hypothetical protein, partial [uncultured Alcanivorax sp.]|uniref:hypothetical protein n=1 Tax=uncultured Alcanivorax sp. TaxID=191215 RepID=UPI002611FE3F